MQNSEDHLNIPDLLKEFKNIDIKQRRIKKDFTLSVHAIISEYYPNFQNFDTLKDALEQYASHIINATDSVIDKDTHYPEYRLKEELETMQALILNGKDNRNNTLFFEEILSNSKRIMVKYFPKLIHLSGNGFRLLNANAIMYCRAFERDYFAINNSESVGV